LQLNLQVKTRTRSFYTLVIQKVNDMARVGLQKLMTWGANASRSYHWLDFGFGLHLSTMVIKI